MSKLKHLLDLKRDCRGCYFEYVKGQSKECQDCDEGEYQHAVPTKKFLRRVEDYLEILRLCPMIDTLRLKYCDRLRPYILSTSAGTLTVDDENIFRLEYSNGNTAFGERPPFGDIINIQLRVDK